MTHLSKSRAVLCLMISGLINLNVAVFAQQRPEQSGAQAITPQPCFTEPALSIVQRSS